MSTFITNTPLSKIRAIGSEGERSHARMTALLARYLSPDHAAILADPVPMRDGSGIDWYIDDDTEAAPLSELDATDSQAVREKLTATLDEIRDAADRLESEDPGKHATAAALRNAATFPGEECIFAVRDENGWRPLIVAWNFQSSDNTVQESFDVSAFGPRRVRRRPPPSPPPPAPPAAAAVPIEAATAEQSSSAPAAGATVVSAIAARAAVVERRAPWAWLLYLLAVLIPLLIFLLIVGYLLPACGLRTPFGTIVFGLPGNECHATAATATNTGYDRGPALARELDVLRQQYLRRRMICLTEPNAVGPQSDRAEAEAEPTRIERRGDVQVTLQWDTVDDLDLKISCPNGDRIWYNRKQACGGDLDVDRNSNGPNATADAVENITFADGLPMDGPYGISVNLYRRGSTQQIIPYTVWVRDENGTKSYPGSVDVERRDVPVTEFSR